jgi:hypothetical protein
LARLFPTCAIALGAKKFEPSEYKQLDNGLKKESFPLQPFPSKF